MTRAEILAIADMGRPLWDQHRRNGNLPFDVADFEAFDASGKRRWVRYTIREAAALIAARQLADGQGVTWSEACAMLRAPAGLVGEIGTHPADWGRGPHIFAARVEFADATGADPMIDGRFEHYRGPLPAVLAAAQARVDAHARAYRHARPTEIRSLASVNLTRAYATAIARAEAKGIEWEWGSEGELDADES